MTREELMRLCAEKAVREMSWDSIEFLFRPVTGVDLLLRLDFDGMKQKISDWITDDSPGAMPFRFRDPHIAELRGIVKREEFYRAMCSARMVFCRDAEGSVNQKRDDIFRKMCN